MKPTKENKERFFHQYHGQKVIFYNDLEREVFGPYVVGKCDITPIDYLLLTSLQDITDEDLMEVGRIYFARQGAIKQELDVYIHDRNVADFLRSKSYALPFDGSSVEQLIEYGWMKIREI